ncbi:MAG: hypothetical protein ACRC7C_10605, partial [Beijerinckiaceae bacterium]
ARIAISVEQGTGEEQAIDALDAPASAANGLSPQVLPLNAMVPESVLSGAAVPTPDQAAIPAAVGVAPIPSAIVADAGALPAPQQVQQSALIDHDGISEFDVKLTQDIEIDTIVHVDVNGFAGEVIIDTRISEHANVRQEALPTITLTGDEDGFDINISQLLDIDLLSDLDIEIVENGGKLYLTIVVKDSVSGTDTAAINISDGADEWLDVDLIQSADVDQRLTVSVDLEQELAALFDVDVDVDVDLDIDIDQTGEARIGFAPGQEIDVGLDGDSEIDLVNNIHIRIDFTPQ